MQILELLGSSAPTTAPVNLGNASTNDAFSDHLDEVLVQRRATKAEDAKRHDEDLSARPEVADVEEANIDDNDEVDELNVDGADDHDQAAAESPADSTTDTNAAATTTAGGIISTVLEAAKKSETDGKSTALDSDGADQSVIIAATSETAAVTVDAAAAEVAKPVATKANEHAAFKNNSRDNASNVASENAGPFATDPNQLNDEEVVAVVGPAVIEAAVSDGNFGEDMTIAAEVASLVAAPIVQADAPKVQDKTKSTQLGGSQGPEKAQTNNATPDMVQAADAIDAANGAASGGGTDVRQEAMKLAEAVQNAVNAESIFSRFAPGQAGATPVAQVAAGQANVQPQAGTATPPGDGQSADVNAKTPGVATQLPSAQSVQSGSGAQHTTSALATPAPTGDMDDFVLSSLLQSKPATPVPTMPANAASPATTAAATGWAQGTETSSASSANTAPTPAAVGAVAETPTPNATQAAAAVRPATPPPPAKQTPQIQVAMQIAKAVQNGTDRISIRLNPAELGRVDIKLEISQTGLVAATITVDRPETLEMLRADSRSLEQALLDAGLDANRENLNFSLRDQGQNGKGLAQGDDGPDGFGGGTNDDADSIGMALADARRNGAANRALDINV